jgi:hypothetical protein
VLETCGQAKLVHQVFNTVLAEPTYPQPKPLPPFGWWVTDLQANQRPWKNSLNLPWLAPGGGFFQALLAPFLKAKPSLHAMRVHAFGVGNLLANFGVSGALPLTKKDNPAGLSYLETTVSSKTFPGLTSNFLPVGLKEKRSKNGTNIMGRYDRKS